MLVQLGNVAPLNAEHELVDLNAPSVTYVSLPESDEESGQVGYDFDPSLDVADLKNALVDALLSNHSVTNVAGAEAVLAIVHPDGLWAKHSNQKPSWVDSDNAELAQLLGAYWNIPVGVPSDVEATHFTRSGPPGVRFSDGPVALLTNNGRNKWALMEGGQGVAIAGGTATATSSTSLTSTGFTASAYVNCIVVAGSGSSAVYGNIVSNTTTVLTVERWNNFATPGGAAGTTPGSTTTFNILSVSSPAQFCGITPTAITPAGSDTTLSGEITTSGGGLIRKITTWAHTAGANTYTQTVVFTANSSDSLPVTVQGTALFDTIFVGAATSMMFEDALSPTATLSASGDQLTLTWTVTGS